MEIPLDDKAFRYFNVKTNRWEVEAGDHLGRCRQRSGGEAWRESDPVGTKAPAPYGDLSHYCSAQVNQVTDGEFEAILGRPIPDGSWNGLLTENDAICQLSYAKGAVARFAYKILKHLKDKSEKKGKPDLNILFIYNMPFRAMAKNGRRHGG